MMMKRPKSSLAIIGKYLLRTVLHVLSTSIRCVLLRDCVSAFYSARRCKYYSAKNPPINNDLLSLERVLLQ
jgi:hypothetical protein